MTVLSQFIPLVPVNRFGRGIPDQPPPESWQIAVVFGFAALVILLFVNRFRRQKRSEKGVWPVTTFYNRDSLFEAYVSAAAILTKLSVEDLRAKHPFMDQFFKTEFPGEYYSFKNTYLQALQFPVGIESLTDWLNRHLNTAEKEKLVRFLVDLAFSDGSLNEEELNTAHNFAEQLKVDPPVLQR